MFGAICVQRQWSKARRSRREVQELYFVCKAVCVVTLYSSSCKAQSLRINQLAALLRLTSIYHTFYLTQFSLILWLLHQPGCIVVMPGKEHLLTTKLLPDSRDQLLWH